MLALSLFVFFGGYAFFLLGFAVFMHFENRKFGDNQFTVKLLPPPPRHRALAAVDGASAVASPLAPDDPVADWTPVPAAQGVPAAHPTRPARTLA